MRKYRYRLAREHFKLASLCYMTLSSSWDKILETSNEIVCLRNKVFEKTEP